MNEQNPLSNPISTAESSAPTPVLPKFFDLLKDVFKKFRENKKLFRLAVILLGAMFIIIIVGFFFSVFKNRGGPEVAVSPTPQPTQIFENPEANKNIEKLKNLKEKMFNIDIYQKRLSPPTINFKVDF